MATRRNFLEKSTQLAAGVLAAGAITASISEAQTLQPQAPRKKLHHFDEEFLGDRRADPRILRLFPRARTGRRRA